MEIVVRWLVPVAAKVEEPTAPEPPVDAAAAAVWVDEAVVVTGVVAAGVVDAAAGVTTRLAEGDVDAA
jgi:hypothetical protein